MRQAAARYEVPTFYLLAFAIAWASWFVMARLYDGVRPSPAVYVFSTLGGLAPLISLAILDRLTRQEISLRQILSRIRLRGTRPVWFLLAALIYPLTIVLGNLGTYLSGMEHGLRWIKPGPDELGTGVVLVMVLHFATSLVTSPLFEEPGWRGFALGRLQARFGGHIGSLIVGVLWWAWHQPMNLAFGIQPSLPGFLSMLALSFMIDSLFNLSGGNLLTAMLAHQSSGTALAFLYQGDRNWLPVILLIAFVTVLRVWEHACSQAPAPGREAAVAPSVRNQ